MKKKLIILGIVLGVCIVLAGIYCFLTRDQRAVVNTVEKLAATLHLKSSRLAHEGVLKHQKIGEFFADRISLRSVDPEFSLDCTNEGLVQNAAIVFRYVGDLDVKLADVTAKVAGESATFDCDAEIYSTMKDGKEKMSGVYRVSGSAEKIDGNWKISSIVVDRIVK